MGTVIGNNVIEYIEETSEGVTPTNPTMLWIDLVNPFTLSLPQNYTVEKYLAANGSSNKLGSLVNVQHKEQLEISLTVKIQDLSFWSKYCLGSATGTSDSLPSISFGLVVDVGGTNYYAVIKGAKHQSSTLSVEEDGSFTLEATFRAMDFTGFSTSDYIGTGAHATEDTSTPLVWKNVTAMTWKGGNDFDNVGCYIKSFSIDVSHELREVKDVGVTNSTGIKTIQPVDREITFNMTADFSSVAAVAEVRNGTKADVIITVSTNTITIKNVIFPDVGGMEFNADDLIEQDMTSQPATQITVA